MTIHTKQKFCGQKKQQQQQKSLKKKEEKNLKKKIAFTDASIFT